MRERQPKTLRGPVPRNKEDDQVVYIDNDSAPRILFSGEDLLLEDLPVGTRVIYPKPPIEGLANPGAAIRYALNHPLDAEPLYAQLMPGMRVTIAVDDISLPLPPMATPDVRQTIIEILLELLDANGVDDVHIIIANSLHRKMTEAEMKRMVGSEDPQRVLSRSLLQPRRRGSRRDGAPGRHRPRRAGQHQPARGRERPASSTSTSTWSRWTAATSRSPSACATTTACARTTSRRRSARRTATWIRRSRC